jgi:hypothetical protein
MTYYTNRVCLAVWLNPSIRDRMGLKMGVVLIRTLYNYGRDVFSKNLSFKRIFLPGQSSFASVFIGQEEIVSFSSEYSSRWLAMK